MSDTPINLLVAKAIIKAGYILGTDESRYISDNHVEDSPYYTIHRYPVSTPRKLTLFEAIFPQLIPTPQPIWVGTIYFNKMDNNHESRFATGSLWTIMAEESLYIHELEELAHQLTLQLNPVKVYTRRL